MSEHDATGFGATTPDPAQPGYPAPEQPQPGYPQQAYAQPGYPQQAYAQPGYPPPGYPPPGYAVGGYPYPAAPPSNTLAVTSLVLGIVGLVVIPFLGSIAAVVTGHIARRQIRERGEGGDGLAIGGLVTGYLGAAFWLLIGLFFLVIPFAFIATSASTTG